jgi:hypothetical protein
MNLQEQLNRIQEMMGINEIRVPKDERVELYKDDNIIVTVPLTHRALQKYANRCQWCINSDLSEWTDYHKGKHAVIIQRNTKKPKMGITGIPMASELFVISKWGEGGYQFDDVCDILQYDFEDENELQKYEKLITSDINNLATNIVYYSPQNGIYDMEDNYIDNYGFDITDIPNVTPEVKKIMDNYLQPE